MLLTPEQLHILEQLALAVVLGSIIGIERTRAHSLAGFRTFAMLALGACAFTVIGNLAFAMYGGQGSADPLRVAGQIVVGVGFLAGGLLIVNKEHAHGLTTSAGLWVAAAIGMAVGFDFYAIAIFVTVLTLLVFGLFWNLERRIVDRK